MKFNEQFFIIFSCFLIFLIVPSNFSSTKQTPETLKIQNDSENKEIKNLQDSKESKEKSAEESQSDESIYNNENVKHSTFTNNNQWNRISASDEGVPIKNTTINIRQFPNPDSYVAYKVAVYYKQIFEFLDENLDDLIQLKELETAYNFYDWPLPQDYSVEEWVKIQFNLFKVSKKDGLDLVEFSKYLESIWNTKEQIKIIVNLSIDFFQ